MEKERITSSANDIKIYAKGIELSARKNKLQDVKEYVSRIRNLLDDISKDVEG